MELTIRMLGAAAFGAAIGYERELRGKGAGVRTHLLVALGSALFMIISQYGFADADKFDASRIAAGVVGGLGFLGGGIIMKNKHISGLTTAAGLWVTGAMGLAMGCGMYEMSVLCTVLILFCMEVLHFYSTNLGERQVNVTLSGKDDKALAAAVESLGRDVSWFSLNRQEDVFKAEVSMMIKKKESPVALLARLSALPGVQVENME
ncbi:MAG: MgtC/SapB family protein [Bacteroidales bacterium]|nr:MgtC/SapB family protein [Bacteroidales bacterium]